MWLSTSWPVSLLYNMNTTAQLYLQVFLSSASMMQYFFKKQIPKKLQNFVRDVKSNWTLFRCFFNNMGILYKLQRTLYMQTTSICLSVSHTASVIQFSWNSIVVYKNSLANMSFMKISPMAVILYLRNKWILPSLFPYFLTDPIIIQHRSSPHETTEQLWVSWK